MQILGNETTSNYAVNILPNFHVFLFGYLFGDTMFFYELQIRTFKGPGDIEWTWKSGLAGQA